MHTNTTHPPAIELRDLVRTFGRSHPSTAPEVRAVAGIDLTVRTGEVVAVLGHNGAGKTTTLDMVLGLIEPTSGSVNVFGAPPRQAIAAGHVSAVLQTGGLLRDLTVRETVRMIASTYAAHTPVDDVIERTGLRPLAERRVSKCSGGEQQRLRFALALLPDPRLLVLDEPTAGMDVGARRDFWQTMHADADSGRTVVFATHYLEEADAFADRIILMAGGRIVADGTTTEIRSMTSGRTVSATLDPAHSVAHLDRVRRLEGVIDVGMRGARISVVASDSDALARVLLTELGATDLEITTASLEQAFMALTGEADGSPPSGIPLSVAPRVDLHPTTDESLHPTKELAR